MTNGPGKSEYLLISEVAELLRTAVSTVRYWLSIGKLRSVRPGRRRLVAAADVERLLTSREKGGGQRSA